MSPELETISNANVTPDAGRSVDELVVTALRRIIRAIDLHSKSIVKEFGITGPQIIIMKELSKSGPLAVCDLKKYVHLSQPTVTGIIDRLEQKSLVKREKSSRDKRKNQIYLTDYGRKVLDDAPPLLQEQFIEQFKKLRDWERMQILSSLQRVVSMMEAKDIDATAMLTTGEISEPPGRINEKACKG
jgi:DNA-binding MarR family transcriptional regulator